MILIASALVAATTLIAKALGTDTLGPALHPTQVTAGRFVFAFSTLIAVAPFLKLRFTSLPWRPHLMRTFFGFLGVSCMFAAASQMPLGEATAISFLSPIAAMILAIPLLGEKVGPIRWSAAGISCIGALILIRPGMDAFQIAALIALAAAIFLGFEIIFIKRLTNTEPAIRILFVNNMLGMVLSLYAASFFWRSPTPEQWALLVAIGCVMVTAQSFYIQAMKFADASFVVPFSYATLVFATLYDFAVFGVISDSISMLGALVIIMGALFLAFRERQLGRA
jgi:drug/metabolite transporter (DMT)-like permease